MKRVKKIIIETPIYLKYTEKLSEAEYKEEIKGVIEEIKRGAREWAYSVILKEGKSIIKKVG